MSRSSKPRFLAQEALDAMLSRLDPDRERAGLGYEAIRRTLIGFLRFNGSVAPEDQADKAIDIVANRILNGEAFDASNPKRHFLAVARNLLRDEWKIRNRRPVSLEVLPPRQEPFNDPHSDSLEELSRVETERRNNCLSGCLKELVADDRELIRRYYLELTSVKKMGRREIAGETGRSMGALRVKVHRVRRKLERCCERCMNEAE